ncbi:hypothetical protein [Azospira restricta]|uniref:Uncharacterized protein n=1 Tax=Azospira restricta TaxID=404405 RepID=A0A974PVY7_9RHOO|nr:hypothetical protein [Azospira restricta]QRJ62194.1 hypothetical protein IWH25_10315 [Azospira restricta]
MILLAVSAATTLPLALLAGASGVLTPAAAAHVAFAIGIVPLVFGAMLHFVPVLTRSGSPQRWIGRLPFLAQAAGLVVVLALQGILPRGWLHPAATIDAAIAVVLVVWMRRRSRRALGSPHPGWRWYAASLLVLVAALAVVPPLAAGIAPLALRNLHLHLNTLGFIGLAALGTLPVLLPTALGQPDPQAAPWLRRRLPVAVAGVLLLALGAALAWPLALVGAAFLGVTAGGLLAHWLRSFGWRALAADGATAPLAAALAVFALLQLAGAAHGLQVGSGYRMVAAFAAGFLLPLVTGALSQLLPVWRWPGPKTPARDEMRRRLVRCGRLRALLLPAAGLAFAADQAAPGVALAAAGLLLFFVDLASALRVARQPR